MARRPRTRVMKPRGSPPVMDQGPSMTADPVQKPGSWITKLMTGSSIPSQVAADPVQQRPAMDLLEQEIEKALLGINNRPGLSTDPNRRARLPAPPPMMPTAPEPSPIGFSPNGAPYVSPLPPAPPPVRMPDPVQAAVNKLPGEPGFPGRGPKFPGVPPVQIPEPVGPIGTPPPIIQQEPFSPPDLPGFAEGPRTGEPVDVSTLTPVGAHPMLGEIYKGPGGILGA